MTCHPPVHLRPEAIRREGQGEAVPRLDADPLFGRAGIDLDKAPP
jgi:hypothetical protein